MGDQRASCSQWGRPYVSTQNCVQASSVHRPQQAPPSIALHSTLDSPQLGALIHHVLPLDRLPGRPACCPPAGPPPDPAPGTRSARVWILPVRGRRGQGRQVRQQRLCRPHDDARAGCKGRHAVPATARPDRGPCQLRIPGTHAMTLPPITYQLYCCARARLTANGTLVY
jgi:hypothetical protein